MRPCEQENVAPGVKNGVISVVFSRCSGRSRAQREIREYPTDNLVVGGTADSG